MKLAYWMYAGPAHIGALRVAASFKNVHAIMHAPLGDDYFNVMRSMLERERDFTPVTTSVVDRHVLARGSQEKVVENIIRKNKEDSPDLIILTPTCTSSILQEDLQNFVDRAITNSALCSASVSSLACPKDENLSLSPLARAEHEPPGKDPALSGMSPLLSRKKGGSSSGHALKGEEEDMDQHMDKQLNALFVDINHYRVNELQAADRTLEQIVRFYLEKEKKNNGMVYLKELGAGEGKVGVGEGWSDPEEINPNSVKSPQTLPKPTKEHEALSGSCSGWSQEDLTTGGKIPTDQTKPVKPGPRQSLLTEKPSANIIGIFTLGFHNQHDCRELKKLLNDLGIEVNEIIPEGASVKNLKNLPKAWFNLVPYREVGLMTAVYLEKEFQMPYVSITPMGLIDTASCIRNISKIINAIQSTIPEAIEASSCTPLSWACGGVAQEHEPPAHLLSGHVVAEPKSKSHPFSPARGREEPVLWVAEPLPGGGSMACPTDEPPKGTNQTSSPEKRKAGDKVPQDQTLPLWAGSCGAHARTHEGQQSMKDQPQKPKTRSGFESYIESQTRFVSQAAWFSRSIDCQNLTGKKAVVFGDATHAASMTKILAREMGIKVVCAGTYCKHDADWFREQVVGFCDQILITDDHTQVGDMIARLEPSAIFGTQMERHVGKRLDIPCGVISAPVHIQNFPLGYRPFLGYEGSNQIADLVYNSFTLGMEDHLLSIFGGHDTKEVITKSLSTESEFSWSSDGLAELNKIPGFVRGKVKRNTEKYARQNNINLITVEVMFAAKEAVGA